MAVKIRTVTTYNLDGVTTSFTIPFEYLARKFVTVTLIGTDRKELVLNQDYRFSTKTHITTSVAWGAGSGYQLIEIRRFTSATERLVDFSDGSILRAYDLNISQIQTLHVAEEARDLTADTIGVNNDGHLDARGRRIVNLADPKDPLDAVNLRTIKQWNDGAYQSYVKANQEAEKAAASALAAKNSQSAAASSQSAAASSQSAAAVSATAAKNSETNAKASQSSASSSSSSAAASAAAAKGSESYTKTQADRSFSEAERAKGYADDMGNSIATGKVIESINTSTNDVIWKGNQLSKGIGVGYPRVPGVASPATHFGYHNDTEKTPRLYMVDQTGGAALTFPWETGTFATREWINKAVSYNGTETALKNPSGDKNSELIVKNDGTVGAYNYTHGRWLFQTDGQGFQSFGSHVIISDIEQVGYKAQRSDGTSVQWQTSPYRSNEQGVEAFGFYEQDKPAWATNVNQWSFTREGSVTIASREWVDSQGFLNTASSLGALVSGVEKDTGTKPEMTAAMFSEIMSQVPDNGVFCGVTARRSGSRIYFTPKWRLIE